MREAGDRIKGKSKVIRVSEIQAGRIGLTGIGYVYLEKSSIFFFVFFIFGKKGLKNFEWQL